MPLGRAEFAGLTFVVTPDVLIPRWETEWLVQRGDEWLREQRARAQLMLLDLGCGCGCIGLTLAVRHPRVSVTLADVSEPALDVARENARRLGVERALRVPQRRLVRAGPSGASASTPSSATRPTSRGATTRSSSESVQQHEPSLALFLEDDPQEFFFRLARKAVSHLQHRRAVRRRGGL